MRLFLLSCAQASRLRLSFFSFERKNIKFESHLFAKKRVLPPFGRERERPTEKLISPSISPNPREIPCFLFAVRPALRPLQASQAPHPPCNAFLQSTEFRNSARRGTRSRREEGILRARYSLSLIVCLAAAAAVRCSLLPLPPLDLSLPPPAPSSSSARILPSPGRP